MSGEGGGGGEYHRLVVLVMAISNNLCYMNLRQQVQYRIGSLISLLQWNESTTIYSDSSTLVPCHKTVWL